MKNHFLIPILILFLALSSYSQSPQGIPYQAVVRNADGSVMESSVVNLILMIHDGSVNGTVVFQETHALTSNAQGLVSCVVGNGVVSQGNFSNINWGSGPKFLHVMMGTTDLGTQQLMSVPYALYSDNTNVSISAIGDTLTIGGNSVIVPGISAANPTTNGGLGAQVLAGNTTCANEYISVTGCGGQTSLTYDGRAYDLVEIGGQCWFADNLATDQYRNGDLIPTGLDNATWAATTSGAYAIYNNDVANDPIYGKLYNWYTTVDSRGLCPTGWHVPTDCEWMHLEGSLGMAVADQMAIEWRGNDEGGQLKSMNFWLSPNTGANDSFDMAILPGGLRGAYGDSYLINFNSFFWSVSINSYLGFWYRRLTYDMSTISRFYSNGQDGFSIRCLRD